MRFNSKFSFGQMTSNSNGKTSGSGVAGLYIVFIGGLCFLLGVIDKIWFGKDPNIITQAICFASIGVSLLLGRKMKEVSGESEKTESDEKSNEN